MSKTRRTFTQEFKAQAVKLVTAHARSLTEVARDLDLSESLFRGRKRSLATHGDQALPGNGNPPALEEKPRRLRSEVNRLTMGRDVLRGAAAFLAGGVFMGDDFVDRHRGRWTVRPMRQALRVSPGGYCD